MLSEVFALGLTAGGAAVAVVTWWWEKRMNINDRFPDGKMNEDDQGAMTTSVGVSNDDKVVIEFQHAVTWIAFPRDDALAFAEIIRKHAETLPLNPVRKRLN